MTYSANSGAKRIWLSEKNPFNLTLPYTLYNIYLKRKFFLNFQCLNPFCVERELKNNTAQNYLYVCSSLNRGFKYYCALSLVSYTGQALQAIKSHYFVLKKITRLQKIK